MTITAEVYLERLRIAFAETDIPGDLLFLGEPGDSSPTYFFFWEPTTEEELRTLHRASILAGRNELEGWPSSSTDFDEWLRLHAANNPGWQPPIGLTS